ncbi:MAG: LacI family transcriptional regulator, partial [Clostridiales bacterium]|nr:LacI family transcriptional regulator [Clostridiales bacterium]MDY4135059.1 LacI family transcriptional regulator [Terrisporobacter sp.]
SIGDTRISQVVSPKLTTIHYHYKTSGRKSAEIMIELLKSGIKTSKTIKKNIKLSYILIERNSA